MIFTQFFLTFVQQFIAIGGAIKHFQMEEYSESKSAVVGVVGI